MIELHHLYSATSHHFPPAGHNQFSQSLIHHLLFFLCCYPRLLFIPFALLTASSSSCLSFGRLFLVFSSSAEQRHPAGENSDASSSSCSVCLFMRPWEI
ncbi:uncharacterized protein TrAtP1_002252 [Trichoderma atroviride]|uniref:uncharacterized protein n=1 Tax=Hypocrea atroviridis TaxID=63577 RepID=UPI0033244D35|nr:hypothetical protein TrAtP1_002252 [Trichoderma atroviride]